MEVTIRPEYLAELDAIDLHVQKLVAKEARKPKGGKIVQSSLLEPKRSGKQEPAFPSPLMGAQKIYRNRTGSTEKKVADPLCNKQMILRTIEITASVVSILGGLAGIAFFLLEVFR